MWPIALATSVGLYTIVSVSSPSSNPFRICALCRHFRVLEARREFPHIADSEYLRYECDKLGWKGREDYLMSAEPTLEYRSNPHQAFDCPHWEEISDDTP